MNLKKYQLESDSNLFIFEFVSVGPKGAVNKIEFGVSPNLLIELEALEITHFEISCKESAGIESLRKKLIQMLQN